MSDYKILVKNAVQDTSAFLRLTLSKKRGADSTPWIKVSLRPILIRGQRKIQVSYFDGKKDISKNVAEAELLSRLDELLALPFTQLHVQSTTGDIHIRITRKGKAQVKRGNPSRREQAPLLQHDHIKQHLLRPDRPDTFLQTIGIMNKQGQVRPSRQNKFRQINEFVSIVQQMLPDPTPTPLRIIDCGCGSAYLTFAVYHYLAHICGREVHITGIDINQEVISKSKKLCDELGWEGLDFIVSPIIAFTPTVPPDMVLSLHACDTATDEALAQGVLWESRVILAVPCCQHELHHKLLRPEFRPLLRHGILRERLADLLTDTFRALLLRIMGYRSSVIEFISPEHTAKNLMIRAERGLRPGHAPSIQEYQELKRFWNVTPILEQLLGDKLGRFLAESKTGAGATRDRATGPGH